MSVSCDVWQFTVLLEKIRRFESGGSESLPLRHTFKHTDLRGWLPQMATLILILLRFSVLGSRGEIMKVPIWTSTISPRTTGATHGRRRRQPIITGDDPRSDNLTRCSGWRRTGW